MIDNPLKSLISYSRFVTELLHRPTVERSTVVVWSASRYTGVAEGEVFFSSGIRLRLREELDFDAGLITSYGYEVYQGAERLYWYDDFPHPHDPDLAATFPHISMCSLTSSTTAFLHRRWISLGLICLC
ncbi:MAG: DUF6516 family protein [Anaerolineae bacterium]|nr:DUF6516 family protein [Anaerolineae bacterium]